MLIIPTAFACLLGDVTKLRCVDALNGIKEEKKKKKKLKIKSKLGVVSVCVTRFFRLMNFAIVEILQERERKREREREGRNRRKNL